jgi:hypothetical protein
MKSGKNITAVVRLSESFTRSLIEVVSTNVEPHIGGVTELVPLIAWECK